MAVIIHGVQNFMWTLINSSLFSGSVAIKDERYPPIHVENVTYL